MPEAKKEKILLIYTSIKVAKANYYSNGLGSIVAVLKENNFEVKVAYLFKFDDEEKIRLKGLINDFSPGLIGFTCVSSQFRFVKKIVDFTKMQFPSLQIVIGGVHPTLFPELLLETKSIDYLFRGEAEQTFLEFCQKFFSGKPVKDIKGLGYLDQESKLVLNPMPELNNNLDALPEPDKETFNYGEIIKAAYGVATFIFNRGCPFSCTYCSNHALAKLYGLRNMSYRMRSVDLAIKEIFNVTSKYKLNYVVVIDEIMGLNHKWFMDFCREYKKHIKVPFACSQRVDVIDKEKLSALKDAGCFEVRMGVESGNDYIRNILMNKQVKRETIISAYALCRKFGLQTVANNMIGLPMETEEEICDTIALNRKILPTSSVVSVFYPYPGTKLEILCRETGLIDEDKAASGEIVERQGSILKLPVSDKRLSWFVHSWARLIYKDPMTILRNPKSLFLDKVHSKIKRIFKQKKASSV